MSESRNLHGVVLAGGKSTRMGTDKAKVVFHGQDLVQRAVRVLETFCSRVWISGRNARDHGLLNPWFMDDAPGKGPLRGILTALEHIGRPCMFLPCDLPLMDASTAASLVRAYDNRGPDILRADFIQQETGFIEALVAIYDPGCIPHIKEALEQSRYKVARAVPDTFCIHVPYTMSQSRPFLNVNYPEDLKLLEQAVDEFCILPRPKKIR
jgi:molybdopterin-guanine dinucleotide biosynthesis protein A